MTGRPPSEIHCQVVNLDTGEIFPIEEDRPPTDTFRTVREPEPPEEVDEKEILKKKIRTGFIAKMLHRYDLSSSSCLRAFPMPLHCQVGSIGLLRLNHSEGESTQEE